MFIYIIAISPLPLPSLTPYFYTSIATHFHFPPIFSLFSPPPSFYLSRSPHPPISSPTYVFGFSSLYSSSSSTTTCALSIPHLPFTDLTSAPSTRMRWSRNWIALAWLHHSFYAVRRTTQPEPIMIKLGFHCQVNFTRQNKKIKKK